MLNPTSRKSNRGMPVCVEVCSKNLFFRTRHVSKSTTKITLLSMFNVLTMTVAVLPYERLVCPAGPTGLGLACKACKAGTAVGLYN